MTLFEHLDALTIHKKDYDPNNDEQTKSYAPYMINRFISMTDVYIPIVNEINLYYDVPKETHYRYFQSVLPRRKHFFKYIKKGKELNQFEKECLCEYFECSARDVERYLKVLTSEEIKKIVSIYKR